MKPLLEICAQGIASALAASEGGADRIELCEHLAVGGITPSAGAISAVCRRAANPVHVLIRPRGGDFVYSDAELEAMVHDIAVARACGASGVVLGVLNRSNGIDVPQTRELIQHARPLSITFHRAFDVLADPLEGIDTLVDLGVDRVLTSGRPGPGRDSIELLDRIAIHTRGRLTIIAAGQVNEHDIPRLHARGLTEFHVGSAACVEPNLVDAARVRQLAKIVATMQ